MPFALRRTTVVLGLILLTGCASTDPLPARTAAAGSAAAPASPAPPVPVSAQTPDAHGASALVTHFGHLMQRAGTSDGTAALAALSDAACEACSSIRQDLERLRREGSHEEGGALHVVDTGPLPLEGARARMAVFAWHDESLAVITSGSATRVISRDAAMWTFRLMWTDAGWRVMSVTHASPEMVEALQKAQPGDVITTR